MAAAADTKPIRSTVGSRDESGFLKNLRRGGFSPEKSFLELIANSLDAKASSIEFIRSDSDYTIKDNGWGMDKFGFEKMFCAQRENHLGEKTRGVSGYGSKPALLTLSNTSSVDIISYKDGIATKASVPWDRMFAESRYDDMITVDSPRQSTPDEPK